MQAYYNIHNLVTVFIESNNAAMFKEYEYYIRNFKVDELLVKPDLIIKDLSVFRLPEKATDAGNGLFYFSDGIFDKKKKYAIILIGSTIELYLASPSLCLNTFIEYFLLKKNATLVHSAAFSYDDKGIIFPAQPNVGKTTLVSRLRTKTGIAFFGDDYVIVGQDASLRAFPADFSIYPYHVAVFPELTQMASAKKMSRRWYEKPLVRLVRALSLQQVAKKCAWVLGYDFLQGGEYIKVPAKNLIEHSKIGNIAPLQAVVFLQKSDGLEFGYEKIMAELAPKEIVEILQSEWVETLPVFKDLETFGFINMKVFIEKISTVIATSFANLTIYKVSIPKNMDSKTYLNNMESFLEKELFNSIT